MIATNCYYLKTYILSLLHCDKTFCAAGITHGIIMKKKKIVEDFAKYDIVHPDEWHGLNLNNENSQCDVNQVEHSGHFHLDVSKAGCDAWEVDLTEKPRSTACSCSGGLSIKNSHTLKHTLLHTMPTILFLLGSSFSNCTLCCVQQDVKPAMTLWTH